MKKLLALATLLIGFSAQPVLAESQTYKFDKKHTEVIFSYRHLGLSRAYAGFNKVDGTLKIDRKVPEKSSINVVIDVKSLDTGVDVFNGHLQAKDFFHSAKYPKATFVSTKVKKVAGNNFRVTGNLTIKGKTKPVNLDLKLVADKEHPLAKFNPKMKGTYVVAFSGKTVIKRSDFGMGLYVPATSDEVEIIIETEMLRK
ncbi:MAG: YceI family protein [Rhodomicrobiaceae bacterium]|jgi:polyisoprenoid-binding protein YceI|nr:MAG: polyisoprenoid-binding protein [Methyloligella sp.]